MRIVTDKRCNVKPGEKYGRLLVIGAPFGVRLGGVDRKNVCVCECDCGNVAVVHLGALRSGHTQSCGCYRDEQTSKATSTHGKSHKSRLYGIWQGIRKRCNYPGDKRWMRYGGRGISVCREWDDFEVFEAWAMANGYADDLTIDRENTNGHYEPSNCRWVNHQQQARNRTSNVRITAFGESKLASEWEEDERCSVTAAGIRRRLYDGFSPEDAISSPRMKPYGRRSRAV